MLHSSSCRSPRERQIDALIAEYELAAEQGRPIAPEDFLQQHAEFAPELREYFSDAGRLQAALGGRSANVSATVETIALQFRDYRVLDKLGAGGMGTVYLALQIHLEKTVALKILKADRERDSLSIARFKGEMRAVGKLEHPHIVRALAAGDEGGTHFLVMEFLEGCDLARLLKNKGRLEVPLACELIRQAALGLQHAHDHHLVHRDVKPSNLMLSTSGLVKVLDLGLAQLQASASETHEMMRSGEIVGTWRYMAPEQFLNGRQVDSRSDIYSLGVTFYSLLAGELPLHPGEPATHLPPIASLRPDVPPDLQVLLSKMLAPQPAERIQTMTDVASALQTYERQGAASIAAIKARLNLLHEPYSSANEPTQSPSGTADGEEVIPPPIQAPSIPPHAIAAPPRVVRPTKAEAKNRELKWAAEALGNATWMTRAASLAGIIAVLSVTVLGVIILCNSIAKNWGLQAAARSEELTGITKRALQRRDLAAADVCLGELSTLSRKFPELVDEEAINGFQNTRRLIERATESQRAVQEALAGQQWAMLARRLKDYLQEPYATETEAARILLADVEVLIARQTTNQARVTAWSDAELAKQLRTRELPPNITIVNAELREIFRNHLFELAALESERRRKEADETARAEADAIDDLRQQAAVKRRKDDEERARLELDENRRLDEQARLEWPAHPERHGILALIPRDAIGAVGVVSADQMLRSCQQIDREILAEYSLIRFFARLFWLGEPVRFSLEKLVRKELETAPLGCYQQDKPLAIVFANPQRARVAPPENLNALRALWDHGQIKSLGVVVGTPIDRETVERQLGLSKGDLAKGPIQHSKLWHFNVREDVYSLMRGGRLYVGLRFESVEAVAESLEQHPSLALDPDLSPQEAARLASMDLLVHFGPGAWRQQWDAIAKEMRKQLAAVNDDPETLKIADDFADITRLAKSFLLGVKLDQGVQASLLVLLARHDVANLERFQQLFGEGNAPLSLAGLPADDALGAFSTRGNGLSSAVIAQSLLVLSQQTYLFPDVHFHADHKQRVLLSRAFQEVWNQVEGTRVGSYGAKSTIIVLDTSEPAQFILRLKELVDVWDRISIELAGGKEGHARYRFAIPEEKFDGRPAYRLSLTVREEEAATEHKLWIVPVGEQMALSYGEGDHAPLRQVIKHLAADERKPGLAEHPAVLESKSRLPLSRKIEVYLWLSAIKKLAEGNNTADSGSADYSSASLTLGENSLLLDVWVPLIEIIRNRDLIKLDPSLFPPN